jgi:hypothetical protein
MHLQLQTRRFQRLTGANVGSPPMQGTGKNLPIDFTPLETRTLVGTDILQSVNTITNPAQGDRLTVDFDNKWFSQGDVFDSTDFGEFAHCEQVTNLAVKSKSGVWLANENAGCVTTGVMHKLYL